MPLAHPSLCVHVGDATDLVAVRRAVHGQDAVISALGAPPTSKARVRERGARALVSAMEAEGVRRLVMLSSHGILESADELPWSMRWLVVPLYLKRAFADHEAQETVVKGHPGLDWTLVRPPHLTDGKPTGTYRHGLGSEVAASMRIPRADVAHFLLHQVPSRDYLHRTPVVSS
jgi:putative NADH-flavin reductase